MRQLQFQGWWDNVKVDLYIIWYWLPNTLLDAHISSAVCQIAIHRPLENTQNSYFFLVIWRFCNIKIREGCGKSKWKFKMAFAMKGGGSRGGLECHIPILKNDFF